ncbi:aromatic ring-hydroxylating dioxygenase subunit alpha [Pseudomonas cavernicola]|uniref:Aromatic ring-hydroxylating dioxygenase subunit alpha n=1 Tax=Pseudomonas cavernicola TaxID=2320866 RepID=A0A418XMC3_9PSED|nr:aromatic ring-hydroxylating dioxygenase subunit alpha [Pseudomonas cavernicola]RJG13620.1 aromatic ring-hydroxylating dioxygenase subunit alpha [Pseudomonas cavernicola]
MYVNNSWYVAATPNELANGNILARTILGHKIALFKTENGQYAAVRDACIHRQAPLSLGHIVGETIQCGYHGARFGTDGRCTHVPGQDVISPKALVRSFPVCERHGFIWIWMGDPELAVDESTIPKNLALLDAKPEMRSCSGLFESMRANYRLLNDNLFDITHAEFVHPESFGGEEVRFYRNAHQGSEPIDRGLTYEIKERSIHFRTHADSLGDEGAPLWRIMMAQARNIESWTGPLDFTMEVSWHAPCYTSFHIYLRPAGQPDATPVEFHDFHAAIPETANSSHYFYTVGINYGDENTLSHLAEETRNVFKQDIILLEAQQVSVGDLDVLSVPHASFSGDRLQLEGRKILDKLLNKERQEKSIAQEI